MFTGIVEEVGKVVSVPAGSLVFAASRVLNDMQPGNSVSVNGVCLTVNAFDSKTFSVNVMPETLRQTNLGRLRRGDIVNLERALALGGQVGGHLVQGHVDDTGTISSINKEGEAILISIKAPPGVMRYIVHKGFIAVDGASLTVTVKDTGSFTVSIVDYTRQNTILSSKKVGDPVNLEVDIIAKYVEQLSQPRRTGVTADLLQEYGFTVS